MVFFVSRSHPGDYRVRQARHVRGTSFSHVLSHMFARSFFRHLSTPVNGEKRLVCKRNCLRETNKYIVENMRTIPVNPMSHS